MLETRPFAHADRPEPAEHLRSGLQLTPWGVIAAGPDSGYPKHVFDAMRLIYLGIRRIEVGLAAVIVLLGNVRNIARQAKYGAGSLRP